MRDRVKVNRGDRNLYLDTYGEDWIVVLEEEFDEPEPKNMWEARFHCERIQTKIFNAYDLAEKVFERGVKTMTKYDMPDFSTACTDIFGKTDFDVIRLRLIKDAKTL